jgi:uncharacterized LabA/DUF88 family protein
LAKNDRDLLAVLIDADNVPAKHADRILEEITRHGEPALRRVYGDWSSDRLATWKKKAQDLGLVTYQETSNTTGKNASDIGLVIDAMDILHTGRFDGFVLVSSDSDFTRLAARIREEGLSVIGIGESKTPIPLRKQCNRFIMIENLVDTASAETKPSKKRPEDALPILLQALDGIEQEDDWIPLSVLGSRINAESPDFDARTYGYGRLSELVNAVKRLETRKDGSHLKVRRRD